MEAIHRRFYQNIDPRWRLLTEIKFIGSIDKHVDGIVPAICPVQFCKGFGYPIETLAVLCAVAKNRDGSFAVQLNRNFCWTKEMGPYGEHDWYTYPSDKFPELYDIDCISLECRLAMALGVTWNMETIEMRDMDYSLAPEDLEERKRLRASFSMDPFVENKEARDF